VVCHNLHVLIPQHISLYLSAIDEFPRNGPCLCESFFFPWVWVDEGFFWYLLTRVVPDRGLLNSCARARVCVCVQCDWLHKKPPLWTPFGFFKTRPDASCCVLFYLHSFTPGSKPIFFINPSHRRLSSFLSTETTDSRQLLLTMSLLFLLSV